MRHDALSGISSSRFGVRELAVRVEPRASLSILSGVRVRSNAEASLIRAGARLNTAAEEIAPDAVANRAYSPKESVVCREHPPAVRLASDL